MLKCDENEFTKKIIEAIRAFYKTNDDDEDDESDEVVEDVLENCNGKKEVGKTFHQKCVICF